MNYKETAVTGSEYLRSDRVTISNPLDGEGDKAITYEMQKLMTIGTEKIIRPAGQLRAVFNADTALTAFPLRNPETDALIGSNSTYQDMYVLLYSLMRDLADKEYPA